jgi:hypothetical protein
MRGTSNTADFWQYRRIAAASVAVVPLLVVGCTSSVEAQIFCPTSAGPSQPGIALKGGFCTNGSTGALSTAALSSQSLSEVTETTTQQSTTSTLEAVEKRRNEEAQRCPSGFERVGGNCRRIAERTSEPAPRRTAGSTMSTITQPARVSERQPAEQRATRQQPTEQPTRERPTEQRAIKSTRREPAVYKAPPMIYEPVRYAVWGQGFGDYERRTGSGTGSLGGPGIGGGGIGATTQNASLGRASSTEGFSGGLDATFRNVGFLNDILIAGVLTGYLSSTSTFQATSLKARIDGPSAGVYATYLNGPFSADLLARVDFLRINEAFSDVLNFSAGVGPIPYSGSGSTNLNDYIVAGDANYRLAMTPLYWLEPTAGFRFTYSDYDSTAAALGLKDGDDLRLLGGLRVGTDLYWGTVRVTPTLTGLAYDDVLITGQVVSGGGFAAAPVIPLDAGKVRGEGIFAVNFDYGNGLSAFALADVRGGGDLFGAGGRAGIRYQW